MKRPVVTFFLAVLFSVAAVAQNAAEPNPPTPVIRSQTRLVLVPVSVRDKNNNHVGGMKDSEFEVQENGKPQKISVFEEVKPQIAPVTSKSANPNEFTNAFDNGTPLRLRLIVLDGVNSDVTDQGRARTQMLKYLSENLDSSVPTGLAVMSRNELRMVYDFTSDPKQLIAAVLNTRIKLGEKDIKPAAEAERMTRERIASVMTDAGTLVGAENDLYRFARETDVNASRQDLSRRIVSTLEELEHLGHALSGLPGRKELIWITAGFPFRILEPGDIETQPLAALYDRTFRTLNDGNVALYPVDIKGLLVQVFADISQCNMCGRTLTSGSALETAAPSNPSAQDRSGFASTLDIFAEMTGGKAFYNTNDLDKSLQRIDRETDGYYMLGYYTSIASGVKPGWRKLKVKSSKDGVKLRSRNGFMLTESSLNTMRDRDSDLRLAAMSPMQYTALPLHVKWDAPEGKKRKFVLTVPGDAATVDAADNNRMDFDVLVVVKSFDKGDNVTQLTQPIKGNLPGDAVSVIRKMGVVYRNQVELSPGQYTVKFIVRDNLSGKTGSVFTPLKVE